MKLEHSLVAMVGAALTLVSCFPDVTYRPDDGGGATGAASTGGGGIGAGGSSGGTGGDTTSSSGGGGEGGGGAPCVLGDIGACGPGEKCSVINTSTGAVDCVTAGDRPAWTRCFSDGDCMDGTWCDDFTHVCHPLCGAALDCDGLEAQCVPAKQNNQTIPGMKLCTSDCHPVDGQPCSDQFGKTTCYYSIENAFWDCIETQGFTAGTPCDTYSECDRGLVCVQNQGCTPWCTNLNTICNGIFFCSGVNPAVTYHGSELGICF